MDGAWPCANGSELLIRSTLRRDRERRLVFSIPLALVSPYLWFVVGALLVVAYRLNRGLFGLFLTKGGLRLAIGGFFLQQLYYLYSMIGLAMGVATYFLRAL